MSEADLQWIVNAYTLVFGGFLLLGGRAGDLLGRKRVFLVGVVVFSVASLLNGLAPSSELLILFRGLQGLGAALISPAAEAPSYVPIARSFLAGLQFTAGNRYQDAAKEKLEVRPVTSLIAPTSPDLRATALAYLKANWLWLVAVLLVLAILAVSALRALRR